MMYWDNTPSSPPSLFALASKAVVEHNAPLAEFVAKKGDDKFLTEEFAVDIKREAAWAKFHMDFHYLCHLPKECILYKNDHSIDEVATFHKAARSKKGAIKRTFILPEMNEPRNAHLMVSVVHLLCKERCHMPI
uniref:Glyco_transf_41 domain-containing protein n=1 Tax=Steinernema glaseri TaxID=37863 RepID=A0A1I8AN02_9BILA